MIGRGAPRRGRPSFAATIIILALLGLLYGAPRIFGLLGGPLEAPTFAAAPAAAVASWADNNWYQLYFTEPSLPGYGSGSPTSKLADAVVNSIRSARRTVEAATFEFDLPAMAEALIDAHDRGLVVRLVVDTDSMGQDAVQRVIAAGVPVVDDGRSAIMHDKFIILDGAAVWTGSWNFSENDTFLNNNNFIHIASTRLAANYQIEFNEMFERREFGPASTFNTPYPQFTVDGALIENYFAPEDGVAQRIVAAINAARENIYFAAFTFTSEEISQALVQRAQAGVTVEGVYETRQVNAGSDQSYTALNAAGLPVLLDGSRYTMHHKFFVIDGQVVITGSYNFTNSAERSNDENILIIHSPEIAQAYLGEFVKVWKQAGGR